MNGTGGTGRWTALPKRVLDRRRLEHKHQGSQTSVHQLCAHPETWDPTLLKHGVHGQKGTGNPLRVCYSSTLQVQAHVLGFPSLTQNTLKKWDLPIHVGQGLHSAEGVNHNCCCTGWEGTDPRSLSLLEVCSLMSPFLMTPFLMIP